MAIKAQPKSVGINFPNRYEGRYNGTATITSVDVVKSENKPKLNGAIAVHLKGKAVLNGQLVELNMVDWFGKKTSTTLTDEEFAQQMINRATGAQLSAGEDYYNKEIKDTNQVRKIVKKIFESLIGKEVTISQYTKEGYSLPNIRYIFDSTETEDTDDDDELDI